MIYAPVLIYTLNRVSHLKRCIDSLKKNIHAEKTEIYISVDYPPSEKYLKGYEEVKKYLNAGINGFREVYVYFHKSNLGPHYNRLFLINKVMEEHDRYIETEDDSEFSGNFLDYMNKGLEMFEDDLEIYAITAMGEPFRLEYKDVNVVKSVILPIHGMGTWSKKVNELNKIDGRVYFKESAHDLSAMWNMFYKFPYVFILFVDDILFSRNDLYEDSDGKIKWCDVPISIFLALSSHYCIKPVISKCKDWGYDGSGVNTKKNISVNMDIAIDSRNDFQYKYKELFEFDFYDNKCEQRYYCKALKKKLFVSAIKYGLYRFFGWDWHVTEKLKSIIVK